MQLLRYSWPHYMPLAKLDAFRLTEAMVSSSLGLTSTVRGSNLGGWGARFSVPIQTDPGAHPVSCTMGTGSFPGVRRPGSGVDHPPWSSTEVKGSAELYLYPPPLWVFVACSKVKFTFKWVLIILSFVHTGPYKSEGPNKLLFWFMSNCGRTGHICATMEIGEILFYLLGHKALSVFEKSWKYKWMGDATQYNFVLRT